MLRVVVVEQGLPVDHDTAYDDVLAAAFAESRKLYAEYAEGNENFRKIYEHWSAYWQKQQQWLRVAELPYDYFTSGQVGR